MKTEFVRIIFAIYILCLLLFVLCEDPGSSDIVRLVEKDRKMLESTQDDNQASNDPESNNEEAEAVEVEEAISVQDRDYVQSPEQILEACNSLNLSFEKECSGESIENELTELVRACEDCVKNIEKVKAISTSIAKKATKVDISQLSECSAMIYTTSLFLSTNSQSEEVSEESNSLELESLEVEESDLQSQLDES